MINGSPIGFFRSSRGLIQGDPLSLYLFVLGMETFSRLINRAVEGGFLFGYIFKSSRGEVVHVSHLLFADDTLIFCKDSREEMTYLSWTMMWLEAI